MPVALLCFSTSFPPSPFITATIRALQGTAWARLQHWRNRVPSGQALFVRYAESPCLHPRTEKAPPECKIFPCFTLLSICCLCIFNLSLPRNNSRANLPSAVQNNSFQEICQWFFLKDLSKVNVWAPPALSVILVCWYSVAGVSFVHGAKPCVHSALSPTQCCSF